MELFWFVMGVVGAVGKVFLLILGQEEVFWFVMGAVVGVIVAARVLLSEKGTGHVSSECGGSGVRNIC